MVSAKNTGLNVSLTRKLVLPETSTAQKHPLHISDTLATVSFRGPEYTMHPGLEGVANLVFDVPDKARSVRGGIRYADEEQKFGVNALFEVGCVVSIRVPLGIGRYDTLRPTSRYLALTRYFSKDIQLDLPVRVCHPIAHIELQSMT